MDIKQSLEILGLSPDASSSDLRQTYRDLVNVWHPDRFQHNPRLKDKAEKQLQLINQAYQTVLASFSALDSTGHQTSDDSPKPKPEDSHAPSRDAASKKPVVRISRRMDRILARTVDSVIFALILVYVKFPLLFQSLPGGWAMLLFIASLLWVFIEANLLSLFGTTPGKWLFGIHVVTRKGKKPPLLEAFKRSFHVWWRGMGAGCIIVMPVTLIESVLRLLKNRLIPWDRNGRILVIHRTRKTARRFLAMAILVMGMMILFRIRFETGPTTPKEADIQPVESSQTNPLHQQPISDPPESPAKTDPNHSTDTVKNPDPDSLPFQNPVNPYADYIKKCFESCAEIEVCRPVHDETLIRETLLTTYGLCGGNCDNLDALPDALRFVGVSGTVHRIRIIFETIDRVFGLTYENMALGRHNPDEIKATRKQVDDLILSLIKNDYQSEEVRILSFIRDYRQLSEKMYKNRPDVVQQVTLKKQKQQKEESARQMKALQELETKRKQILSGEIAIASLKEATWFYHAQDAMPLLINPPLPPLSSNLQEAFYLVSGDIDGLDGSNPVTYRAVVKNENAILYFRFRMGEKISDRHFRIGQKVWVVGRLTGIDRYVTKSRDVRYMPIFEASYIE
ncbi:MAG: RDD family protein [Desulfatirhabdiaceae bacterium]